jgi:hypothetical protein
MGMTEAPMYYIPVTPSNWQQHVILAELEIEEIKQKMDDLDVTEKDVTHYPRPYFKRFRIEQWITRQEIIYQ